MLVNYLYPPTYIQICFSIYLLIFYTRSHLYYEYCRIVRRKKNLAVLRKSLLLSAIALFLLSREWKRWNRLPLSLILPFEMAILTPMLVIILPLKGYLLKIIDHFNHGISDSYKILKIVFSFLSQRDMTTVFPNPSFLHW